MTDVDSHKEHMKNLQQDDIHRTQNMLKMIDESYNHGSKSLELLDRQYEQLQKVNETTDTINHSLETSSTILGKIKYFFFPRKVTKIQKIPNKFINDDKSDESEKSSSTIIQKELEDNIDQISYGISTLKNMANKINSSLDRDKELLDKVNVKSEIVNSNIKKLNKEICKIL